MFLYNSSKIGNNNISEAYLNIPSEKNTKIVDQSFCFSDMKYPEPLLDMDLDLDMAMNIDTNKDCNRDMDVYTDTEIASANNNFLYLDTKNTVPNFSNEDGFLTQSLCPYSAGYCSVFNDYQPVFNTMQNSKPYLSDNLINKSILFFKELSGYPMYGNPSGNADILYTGNKGKWTFNFSNLNNIFSKHQSVILQIQMALDDHYTVPENIYSAIISINGKIVHTGYLPLHHGIPRGENFNNWKILSFEISEFKKEFSIEITNTSKAGIHDWICIDWMQLVLV
jgi:hypothetical protein